MDESGTSDRSSKRIDFGLDPCAMDWFFESAGQQAGPTSMNDIRALAANGKLTPNTRVWHRSFGREWRSLKDTDFFAEVGPPPLPGTPRAEHLLKPSQRPAWLLALAPICASAIGAVLLALTDDNVTTEVLAITYILYAGAMLWDRSVRAQANDELIAIRSIFVGLLFAPFVVPAYLFLRAKRFDQSYGPAVTSIAILVASAVLMKIS